MGSHMGLIACLVVVAALLHGATAVETHVVLDSAGWSVPANGDGAYSTWATNKDFEVNDILVFNFPTGQHNVAEVTKAAYDSCNGTSPISIQTVGPANVTLRTSGVHYYICTVGDHCVGGQKLAITVETSSDGPPAPSTPTGSTPPSGPSLSNSASSIAFGRYISALLSVAIGFLYY